MVKNTVKYIGNASKTFLGSPHSLTMSKLLTFFIINAVLGDYFTKGQKKPTFQTFDGEKEFIDDDWKFPLDVDEKSLDYPSFLKALNEQESKAEKGKFDTWVGYSHCEVDMCSLT